MTPEFIPLTCNPNITFTITPNTPIWCAKSVNYESESDVGICHTDSPMQVCLLCYEQIHGNLPDAAHEQITAAKKHINIKYHNAMIKHWEQL